VTEQLVCAVYKMNNHATLCRGADAVRRILGTMRWRSRRPSSPQIAK
jgi:hypothetical protein